MKNLKSELNSLISNNNANLNTFDMNSIFADDAAENDSNFVKDIVK